MTTSLLTSNFQKNISNSNFTCAFYSFQKKKKNKQCFMSDLDLEIQIVISKFKSSI